MGEELSTSPKSRVKLMCSHGGKILPRPFDGQLKYVGGDTRVLAVPRTITFADLKKKLTTLFEGDLVLKYQLIPEDFEALVSVTSDEDLKYMLEEYDRQESKASVTGGSPRLRAFLFPSSPFIVDTSAVDATAVEQRYLDALNGVIRSTTPSPTSGNAAGHPVFTITSGTSSPQSITPDPLPNVNSYQDFMYLTDGVGSLSVSGRNMNGSPSCRVQGIPRVKSSPSMQGMSRVRSSPSLSSLYQLSQHQQPQYQQCCCHCCHQQHQSQHPHQHQQQSRPACLPVAPTLVPPSEVGLHQMGQHSRYYSPTRHQRTGGGGIGAAHMDGWRGIRNGGGFTDVDSVPHRSVNGMGSGPIRWTHHG